MIIKYLWLNRVRKTSIIDTYLYMSKGESMSATLLGFLNTFRGGTHPAEHKELTAHRPIVDFRNPMGDMVFLMQQHIGAPCLPLVEKGDYILRDQKIGEPQGFVGAPIFSSVSGTVKDIKPMLHPNGSLVNAVIVENDHLYKEIERPFAPLRLHDAFNLDNAEILKRVNYAGLVGMGGAGFPTHIKLNPGPDKKIDYILVNGCECEPYITADYREMLEDTERVVEGGRLAQKLFPNAKLLFCVESNKPNAIVALDRYIVSRYPDESIDVVELVTKYPQGAEKMMIKAATGREVPSGGLPADVGCIVLNIDSVVAIYRAVVQARPLQRRVVTVSGSVVERPGNYMVRIGTSIKELIEFCGLKEKPAKIIFGGPMMGTSATSMDIPIIKTTSSILLLSEKEARLPEESACIRCGRCVSACPIHLEPFRLSQYVEANRIDAFENEYGAECIECGSCSYVCPAKRHLTQAMKYGRGTVLALRRQRAQEAKALAEKQANEQKKEENK